MIPEIPLLASFALLMAVGPYWFFRRTGRRYLVWDVGSWLAIGALIGGAGSIGIAIAPSLLLAVVIGTKLAVFAIALVLLGREEERWSANAAALFSLAVFLLVGTESLQWPLDGDEAYYVLVAESILRDGDLDLRNQYAALERSITGRLDLGPQAGDPVGPGGEAYSRNEPLLSLLLVPGIALAGVWGAMATMALCGALLVRALLLLLEESGAARSTLVRLWPLLAFGSPLLFYSMRVWPEVPAALCLTEAIRCAARRRAVAMLPWLVAMSLLQVRFLVVAATFGALAFARMRPSRRVVAVALLAIVIPLALAWLASGSPLQAHRLGEMAPFTPWKYVRGFFGILLDAQTGMLLQAPLWLAGVLALAFRWRSLPDAVRWGVLAAVPYLVLLLPRDEWHGGWSPPLRYLVVFAPLIAAGASRALERGGGWIAPVAVWTALLAVHGAAFPWRLFHLATGTSVAGEWLSLLHESDFSRLLPSFIRPNAAAWIASLALVCAVAAALVFPRLREARLSTRAVSLGIASLLTAGFAWGLRPGSIVHFEDAHVRHFGGEIHPAMWTVARFRFAGGWAIGPGDAVGFRIAPGPATLWVSTSGWGRIRVDGEELVVSPTRANVLPMKVTIRSADAKIDGIEGIVILDRIERE